ncbi:ComF family protein [Ferrimonas sp. SCSIO 43195]|uniref:ComF family protein n=1 Tax=Ferrimonas sp. SCSIO 43195 TaxID=2822844 RepID=UPI002074B669|nr:ComF family protein [Ferrimonas sp. SCSIO 43195]USD37788.1 ComF family protein [Ferrimonas sp. SCSIO 43195]
MSILYQTLDRLVAVSLPNRCYLCQQPLHQGQGLCETCCTDGQLGAVCLHCHKPLAQTPPHRCGHCLSRKRWRPVISAFDYHQPAGRCAALIKTQHQWGLIAPMVDRLQQRILFYHAQGVIGWPQALVSVPMHRRRLQQQGFNHAHLIAQALSQRLGVPHAETLATKVKATRPQHRLSGRERRQNLSGAYGIEANSGMSQVALVDDIITTGTTLAMLAASLGKQGIAVSQYWTLASAIQRVSR